MSTTPPDGMLAESSSSQTETLHPQSTPSMSKKNSLEQLEAGVQLVLPRQRWYKRTMDNAKGRYPRVYRACSRFVSYVRGPSPPRLLDPPTPFLDIDFKFSSSRWPLFLRSKQVVLPMETWFLKKTRFCVRTYLMLLVGAAYIIGLAFLVRAQWFTIPAESFVTCISTYWPKDDACGLDGQLCQPFTSNSSNGDAAFDFRCPAQCSSVILENTRAVGAEEVEFVPLIVGGGNSGNASFPGSYRGDSFICAAAIHAGLVDDSKGGCASVTLVGTQGPFESVKAHGLTSTAFPTFFPLSLQFNPSSVFSPSQCRDIRNAVLAFNILCSSVIFLLLRPRPLVLYWCLVCMGFWHIIFFSQPVDAPPSVSRAFSIFLPALFICHAFWQLAFRHVLPFFSQMPLERLVWYIGAFWPGVLYNIVTDGIPIDRLLVSDIAKRPGAVVALIIIVIILAAIIINQLRVIRKTGWLPYYLVGYIITGLVIMVLALLPGLEFRLHHYFAAILLIPLTAFPTRLSAIYQVFVLGMFLNGGAAFGFDSILQTPQELQRDGPAGTDLPAFITNSTNFNASISLHDQLLRWNGFPADNSAGWNGFSLIVDDVQRLVGNVLNFSLAGLDVTVPHFFRLAFQLGGVSGDYTKAATLWPNGTWVNPLPGPA